MTITGDVRLGTEFLGYRIEELLGRGGMGVVYRAYDLRMKRNVALKLIAPELSGDGHFRQRFLTETELAASLEHPSVVPIYDAGEHEGQLYLAMRYVEGSDLKALLHREGPLDPARAIAICSQIAEALDAAHARGLVHRDVKPSNVLLDDQEHVYLADFGLSRRLSEQAPGLDAALSLGTPAYVAPEQIEGDDIGPAADVYSLGCLLYECLTGGAPFRRESELAVLWAHLNDPPPAPPSLEEVMARALAKRPEDRYGTCRELVEAARQALGLTIERRRRKPLVLAALGGLVAAGALATGLVLALGNSGQVTPKADLTVRNNSLVRIDPQENEIAAVTSVGRRAQLVAGPVGVAVGGDLVWVHNWDAQTVSAIDPETNTVERTVSIGGSPPFTTGNSIAADSGGAWALSQAAGQGVVTRVQPRLGLPRAFSFDYDLLAVAVGEGAVWVAAKKLGNYVVLRVNPRTGRLLKTVTLPGAAGSSGFTPDIQSLAVGEDAVWALQNGVLHRVNPATGRVSGTAKLPTSDAADVEVGAGAVWVTMFVPARGNVLAQMDPRTLRITKTVTAPIEYGSSWYSTVAIGDEGLWWNGGDSGTIWRVDPTRRRIIASIRLTPQLESCCRRQPVAIAAGGGNVWVTVSVAP